MSWSLIRSPGKVRHLRRSHHLALSPSFCTAESYHELEEKVLLDPVVFPVNFGLSWNLQDLLRRMLAKDAASRISLPEVLSHSWLFGSRFHSEAEPSLWVRPPSDSSAAL